MAENDCVAVGVTSTSNDNAENSSPQHHSSSLPPQSSSPTAASSLSGSANGTNVSLEERVKRLREAEQSKAEQRRIQFLESQRQAELKREKQKEERKRRIEETRQREEARTRMAQERRKELERQHQEHLQGLLERTRERTASVSEPRLRLDHPDMPASMRTSQIVSGSSRSESSNRMCSSYTVAFGSGAPRSICTRISEAALRNQAAFEARLASYLTGRHSGCFLTSSSTYTNYALYVNPSLLPDNHPIHSLRSTHSPQHNLQTPRASARRAASAAPSFAHAQSDSVSPRNRAVDKGSTTAQALAKSHASKAGSMSNLHNPRQRSAQSRTSRPPRAASACRGPATTTTDDCTATSMTSSFPPKMPPLRRFASSQHFAAPTIAFAAKLKGGVAELPLRSQRSKPVVANAEVNTAVGKEGDRAQSRTRHNTYAAPTAASSARVRTVSQDRGPAPADPSQHPPVNKKPAVPTANTRARSQVRATRPVKAATTDTAESTVQKTDKDSKTQSQKSQPSIDAADPVIKLKHPKPIKTPEASAIATTAPVEVAASPANAADKDAPSTTEPVRTADDAPAPAAAENEPATEPSSATEASPVDECPVPPDSTPPADISAAVEAAQSVTGDSPASPKPETVVCEPDSDEKVQLVSSEAAAVEVTGVDEEMTDGMEKKEMAAESQIEAHTEVTSSSPDAAPPPKSPPNETLSTASESEKPSSEKFEPASTKQEDVQEATATPSSVQPTVSLSDEGPVEDASVPKSSSPVVASSPPATLGAASQRLPSPVPSSGPIAISTTGAGEGGSLPEEEAARYRAKMAEQRRLAKERKAAEERRKAEEFELARQAAQERAAEEARLAREARAAAEAEAEQRRLQHEQEVAAAAAAVAEEAVHHNLEERAARDLEKRKELERQRLETLRHEEEERAKRRQKLESIMSRVKGSGQALSRTNTGNSSTQSLSTMVQSLTADSKARSESPANGSDDNNVHFILGGEETSLCTGSMRSSYPDGEQQPQVFQSGGDHVRPLDFPRDSAGSAAAALYTESAVTNGHFPDADRRNGSGGGGGVGDIGDEPGHKLSSSSFKSPLLQSLLGRSRVAGVVSSGQMGDETTHQLLSAPRMTSVDPH